MRVTGWGLVWGLVWVRCHQDAKFGLVLVMHSVCVSDSGGDHETRGIKLARVVQGGIGVAFVTGYRGCICYRGGIGVYGSSCLDLTQHSLQ